MKTPPPVSPRRVYLDFNATAPLRPAARQAMIEAMDAYGNPSSVHAEGRAARAVIEEARALVGASLGRPARDVAFLSGGTEAAAFAASDVFGPAPGQRCGALLIAAGEHPCLLSGHSFPPDRVETVPLCSDGRLDLAALEEALDRRKGAAPALALQAANNETGVVQPVREAFQLVKARGGLTICDAVQALGRLPCADLCAEADLTILSAHKIGGPKGVGALVFDSDRLHMERALVRGGGQERGRRAGTEAAWAIVGFGVACQEACSAIGEEAVRLAALRDRIEAAVRVVAPDAVFFGALTERLPNTSAFAVPKASAEVMVIALDLAGVSVSSGSACSSGKVRPSHVLQAMGVEAGLARCALRVSLGWSTTESEVADFCEAFEKTLRSVLSRGAVRAA